ncbi:MAG TPA: hypothetical protein VJP86_05910, partial [Vicinamibacterales bacterium]|nr:hypothetical protein [Vicinamibacterales bacterium]
SPLRAQPAGRGLLVRAGADRDDKPFKWLDTVFHVMLSGKDCGGRCVITTADQPVEGRRALAEKHGMRLLGAGLTP